MSQRDQTRRSAPASTVSYASGVAVAFVAAAVFAWAGLAFGASLGMLPADAGAGGSSVGECDTAFTHGFTTSNGDVTAVTVGGIADPACDGGRVRVTVKDTTGASIAAAGPQVVPSDGDTLDGVVTLATSPQPAATLVAAVDIVIEGA